MMSSAKANREVAKMAFESRQVEGIPESHRLSHSGDPTGYPPPRYLLPSGVFAVWTGLGAPPVPCAPNYPDAPAGCKWKVIGGGSGGAKDRIGFYDVNNKQLVSGYRYRVEGWDWTILQLDVRAETANNQNNNADDVQMGDTDEPMTPLLDDVVSSYFPRLTITSGVCKLVYDDQVDAVPYSVTPDILAKFMDLSVVSFRNQADPNQQLGFDVAKLRDEFPHLVTDVDFEGPKEAVRPFDVLALVVSILQEVIRRTRA